MFTFDYRIKLLLALCVAAVVASMVVGCRREHDEYIEGREQAERDLDKGEFKIAYADGTNTPAFWQYTELLHRRYHIDWCSYSLPINRPASEAWVRGYNEVALPRVEQEVGVQTLKQVMSDAQKLHDIAITNY